MQTNRVIRMGGPLEPRSFGVCVVILSVLALLAVPIGLEAQGKGGGKPGGGGGDEPEPPPPDSNYLYTLTRIAPPPGTDVFIPYDLNQGARAVGPTYIKAKGSRLAPGPAGLWWEGQSIALPLLNNDAAASAHAIADAGLIVGRSIGSLEWGVNGHTPKDIKPAWWYLGESGSQVGSWQFPAAAQDEFLAASLELQSAAGISHDGRFVLFEAHATTTGEPMAVVAEVAFGGFGAPAVVAWWVLQAGIQHIHHDGAETVRLVGFASAAGEAGIWVKPPGSDSFNLELIPRHEGQRPSLQQVNRHGEMVGNVSVDGWHQAIHFDSALHMRFLGTLGGSRSIVNSINDDSFAVGWSHVDTADKIVHTFIWHPDPVIGMVDLNDITDRGGLELIQSSPPGTLINNSGHIVARAKEGNSTIFVLLTPVNGADSQ